MHQQPAVTLQGQRSVPDPVKQSVAVWRMQDVSERVAGMGFAYPLRHSEQMQVMIAQQTLRRRPQGHQLAQNGERARPTVDQITQRDQGVSAGRKSDGVEQALERFVATLQVAYQIQ